MLEQCFSTHSLFSQRLLFIDADVEVHRLNPQQHSTLDLSGQGVKHRPRERDANVETISVTSDDWQEVGSGGARGLSHLVARYCLCKTHIHMKPLSVDVDVTFMLAVKDHNGCR